MTRFDLKRDWKGLPPQGSHMTLELRDGELYLIGQYPQPNVSDEANWIFGQEFGGFSERVWMWWVGAQD